MSSNIKDIFKSLEDWKKLPAYKAEPRIDFVIGWALPHILKEIDNVDVDPAHVIPELPLRKGALKRLNHVKPHQVEQSFKVDFYARSKCKVNYFVEFKTDSNSINPEQRAYLKAAEAEGMTAIVEGIAALREATSPKYRNKYDHLLGKLANCGLMKMENNKYTPIDKNGSEIKLVYIQPKQLNAASEIVIDFASVAKILRKFNEPFFTHYADLLLSWSSH